MDAFHKELKWENRPTSNYTLWRGADFFCLFACERRVESQSLAECFCLARLPLTFGWRHMLSLLGVNVGVN